MGFADFVMFAGAFGSVEGDDAYDARFDLDSDGGIGFDDFVAFAGSFGDTVNRVPVFAVASPVKRSVPVNTAAGEPIGDPVPATDEDGDALAYSLWGADAEHFAIDVGTAQILSKGPYDSVKKKGFAVIVRAIDGKGGRQSVVVNIDIIDGAD